MYKTLQEISTEFVQAPIGRPISYYRGLLMKDVERQVGGRIVTNHDIERLRDHVWNMYEDGRVCLTQKKLSQAEYDIRQKPNAPAGQTIKVCLKEAVYDYRLTKRERQR